MHSTQPEEKLVTYEQSLSPSWQRAGPQERIVGVFCTLSGGGDPSWYEFVRGGGVSDPSEHERWPVVGQLSRHHTSAVLLTIALDSQTGGYLSGLRFGTAVRSGPLRRRRWQREDGNLDGWREGEGEDEWQYFLRVQRAWEAMVATLPANKRAYGVGWVARFVQGKDVLTALKVAESLCLFGWHALCALVALPSGDILPPQGAGSAGAGAGTTDGAAPFAIALARLLTSRWTALVSNAASDPWQSLESTILPLSSATCLFGKYHSS